MTVRGGGFPTSPLAFMPIGRMGPPLRSFAADAHDCIVVRSLDLPHTRLWRDSTAPESGLPSDCHPDCIIVLEAVRMRPGEIEPKPEDGKNASPCLTQKAPYKGLGAESGEKREPASDIDTGVVDSLNALDPEWPIREADIAWRGWDGRRVPERDIAAHHFR